MTVLIVVVANDPILMDAAFETNRVCLQACLQSMYVYKWKQECAPNSVENVTHLRYLCVLTLIHAFVLSINTF